MKVVIAGASGSGKTTLAKALAESLGWKFQENSAGLIISPKDKEEMHIHWGYTGNWGQQRVINSSSQWVGFGKYFQESVLRARKLLIESSGRAVYDRSALDPIVFWLNQVVHNVSQEETEGFIHQCVSGLREVDLILRLPLQNPDKGIEDNGSRVNNWYFQRKVDSLFDLAIDLVLEVSLEHPEILGDHVIHICRCPSWDWVERLHWAKHMIESKVYLG